MGHHHDCYTVFFVFGSVVIFSFTENSSADNLLADNIIQNAADSGEAKKSAKICKNLLNLLNLQKSAKNSRFQQILGGAFPDEKSARNLEKAQISGFIWQISALQINFGKKFADGFSR